MKIMNLHKEFYVYICIVPAQRMLRCFVRTQLSIIQNNNYLVFVFSIPDCHVPDCNPSSTKFPPAPGTGHFHKTNTSIGRVSVLVQTGHCSSGLKPACTLTKHRYNMPHSSIPPILIDAVAMATFPWLRSVNFIITINIAIYFGAESFDLAFLWDKNHRHKSSLCRRGEAGTFFLFLGEEMGTGWVRSHETSRRLEGSVLGYSAGDKLLWNIVGRDGEGGGIIIWRGLVLCRIDRLFFLNMAVKWRGGPVNDWPETGSFACHRQHRAHKVLLVGADAGCWPQMQVVITRSDLASSPRSDRFLRVTIKMGWCLFVGGTGTGTTKCRRNNFTFVRR